MPELNWMGDARARRAALKVPYRLLETVEQVGDAAGTVPDNLLIQGDNLEALRSLLPLYAGRVKCVFIDPPYNTRSAFEHYDDNLEHSQWLSMMYPRLVLLRELLSEGGSIWITIDDNEAHYLKVVMDEVFGRRNFIANVLWQKVFAPKNTAQHFSEDHDHLLVFAKDADIWRPNPMARTDKQDRAYRNPDYDPRGPWKPGDVAARNFYSKGTYAIECPGGRLIEGPRPGTFWRYAEEKFWELHADNRIWWGSDKNRLPMVKRFKSEVMMGRVPQTLWFYEDVGHTKEAKEEVNAVLNDVDAVFQTTKPERLLKRVTEIATNSVWREHTHVPHATGVFASPLLGMHGDTAIALLYNGILGDRRPHGGNVLTQAVWEQLHALAPRHAGPWLVFGEACRLQPATLKRHGVAFRHIPYDMGLG